MAHTSEHLAVLGNIKRHCASERGRRSFKTCWNSSNAIFVWGFFLSRHPESVMFLTSHLIRRVSTRTQTDYQEEAVNYGDDQRPVARSGSSSIADLTVVFFPAALDTMSRRRP